MIRILHNIGTLSYGGSQALVMEIYRKMDRTKIQFDFVTIVGSGEGFYDEAKTLGANIYISPQYTGVNHFEFCSWWNKFFQEHEEYKVIHGHVRSTASIYLSIAKKYGLVTIAHSHSTSNGTNRSAFVKDLLQIPIRYIADWCFACSDEAGKWLFGKNITKKNNYMLCSNAIDGERFAYSEIKRNVIRKELGVKNKIVVGHNGRFDPAKNHLFIIDVFRQIYELNPNTCLLLIGDGKLQSQIKEHCKKKELEHCVIFTGACSNVEDYYQAMDVFLFPSKWEGLGIAAVEAQTSGLHCVVSKNVPDKVDIGAGLVKFLSLDETAELWAGVVLDEVSDNRCSHLLELKESGYDINELVKKLKNFYIRIANK